LIANPSLLYRAAAALNGEHPFVGGRLPHPPQAVAGKIRHEHVLVTSSFVYALGLLFIREGNIRGLIRCCVVTLVLGLIFLGLKFAVEWPEDFSHHLFPTAPNFKISGPSEGGARLFFIFYFTGTALHGVHMVVGIGLMLWVIRRARRGEFSPSYLTPVTVVGLYWSFVDIVWLTLYPLIYLIGRGR